MGYRALYCRCVPCIVWMMKPANLKISVIYDCDQKCIQSFLHHLYYHDNDTLLLTCIYVCMYVTP